MRAILCEAFGPINDLKVAELDLPSPGAGQVRIHIRAAAVNYPDALIVQGLYQSKPPLPFVPGAEVSGVIDAFGEGVSGLSVGDDVMAYVGQGGFGEYCLAKASSTLKLAPGMSHDQGAALILTYATSLHALRTLGELKAGETLVILGAGGGVGLAAIEIGKAMGARVIAAASSAEKLALCRATGADELIDYTKESLKDRINELTDKQGADVVYDPVGGDYSEAAFRALNWRGRHLVVGFAAGTIPAIPLNLALLKERRILGVFWGEAARCGPADPAANVAQLMSWFGAGKIKPYVSERFTLEQTPEALTRISNRGVKGKIVIVP
jgi:NADPH:quinone reductase